MSATTDTPNAAGACQEQRSLLEDAAALRGAGR